MFPTANEYRLTSRSTRLRGTSMTNTILTRRHLLSTVAAAAALGAVPALAFANSDALLADILVGVGDALRRDYIRENYGRGRWDGRCWIYEGRRYTPREYRDFWLARYQPPHRPAPPPPKPRPAPPPGRPNPPGPAGGPGRGPDKKPGRGPDKGPGRGPGNGPGNGPGRGQGPGFGPGPR